VGRVCRWTIGLYAALYAVALLLLLVGTLGWFGQERDPLAGVFLIPLGLPWVLWAEGLAEALRPAAAALAPLLNILILGLACRAAAGRRG
jgi:hypothetical protein